MDCVLLKDNYNLELLLNDYNIAITESEFIKRKYPKGASVSLFKNTKGWSSIPVHTWEGKEGDEGNILRKIDNKVFKPTGILKKCNYIQKILNDLNTEIYLVRMMKLSAGGNIAPHSDGNEFKVRRKMIRCCIPIITNDQVFFGIDKIEYNLKKGNLYYTRVDKTHWVKNNSDEDRIHLVIDIKPTLKMMEQIGLNNLSNFKKFYYPDNDLNKSIVFDQINLVKNDKTQIGLVMCQWKRFHTLEKILKKIENQTIKVDIYLWNNNYNEKESLIKILKIFEKSNLNIYLYNSPYNIKCTGRLITANILRFLYKNIIFFDDDEVMKDSYVIETFKNETDKYPNTIFSIWALDFLSDKKFYKRKRKTKNNEIVHYAGGCGCIIPSSLFSDKFMKWIPEKYFNVEDYLCNVYIFTQMGGLNRSSNANISFINGEFNSKDSMSWGKKYCDRTGIEIHELKNQALQWSIENYKYPNLVKKDLQLKVIVPFYNVPIELLDECLSSIANQSYNNYTVCIIDDASNNLNTDRNNIINKYTSNNNWHLIVNDTNVGPLVSRDRGIKKICDSDDDVVVLVDGDDKLANNEVFKRLTEEYKKDIYLTFGNCLHKAQNKKLWNLDIIDWPKVIVQNKYREVCQTKYWNDLLLEMKNKAWKFPFQHLRTFKYFLYKKIKDTDKRDKDNNYFKSATDKAIMLPMLEMSGGKFSYINDVLYIYNNNTKNNIHSNKKNFSKQTSNSLYINNLKKYNSLFDEISCIDKTPKFDKRNRFSTVKFFKRSSKKLIIVFNHRAEWFYLNNIFDLINEEYKVLFLRDVNNEWYLNGLKGLSDNIDKTIEFLKKKIIESECENIVMIGSSAGGFGAILYGTLLNVNKIIVFNPITYLDNDSRKLHNDNRFTDCQKLKLLQENKYANLKCLGKSESIIKIMYSNNPIDRSHFENIYNNKNLKIVGEQINYENNFLDRYLESKNLLKKYLEI